MKNWLHALTCGYVTLSGGFWTWWWPTGLNTVGANRLTWCLCHNLCSRDLWFLRRVRRIWTGAGLEKGSRPANGWQRRLGAAEAQYCAKSVLCGHFIFYTWMFVRFPVAISKTLETAQKQLCCAKEAAGAWGRSTPTTHFMNTSQSNL